MVGVQTETDTVATMPATSGLLVQFLYQEIGIIFFERVHISINYSITYQSTLTYVIRTKFVTSSNFWLFMRSSLVELLSGTINLH